jgi:hypothetical protein
MSPSAATRAPAVAARPASARVGSAGTWARIGSLSVAAIVVYRGALGYFFAQDDFAGLARARGVLPRLAGPWRWLSGQGYFDLMRAVSDLDPRGYRVASLAAFVGITLLAYVLYRRRTVPAAAWLGAVFYAAHPAHFTALYSVSGIGELLSPLFGLAAVLALDLRGARRALAPACFALSLGCKETTLLLPLVALLRPRPEGTVEGVRRDLRDPAWWAMAALAAAYVVAFLAGDPFGVRSGLGERAAYATRLDGTLLANASTYLGWTANAWLATVRSFADAVDPGAAPWAVAVVLAAAGGLVSGPLRARGFGFGVTWFAATLLPVLPLANHTYHYYLVTPLVGAGACVAAVADRLWARGTARAPARAGAGPRAAGRRPARSEPAAPAHARLGVAAAAFALIGAAWTLNGALLVHKNETYPFTDPELRSDATVDRARIARHVHDDLAAATLPPGTTLRFWSPSSIQRDAAEGRDPKAESYWERNVRNAVLGGVGVRVMFPNVARVEFVRAFAPSDSARWAVYRPDGRLRVATSSELAAALRDFERSR